MKAQSESLFKVLSDKEHILMRPAMYIGAIEECVKQEYIIENGKFVLKDIKYVPGLLKIINEVLDNSIDEAIRTKFKFANKIRLNFLEDSISIEDNGRGIPVEQVNDKWRPELAWTQPRAGTNFTDTRSTIGMNGLGVVLTTIYSTFMCGETHDGKQKCIVTCADNMNTVNVKVGKSSKQGTKVTFKPDLKRFKLKASDVYKENSIYQVLVYQRLMSLSICYPEISFYFNGKLIKTNNLKSILSMFGEEFEFAQADNCVLGIFNNPEDEFKFFTYVNGLRLSNGGQHIDIITNDIVAEIREKLLKKYKTIKPGEIKSKLFVVFYGWDFKNPKFDSQSKERLTNSTAEVRDFLKDIDLDTLAKKCLRNKALIDPIVEIYKIKEEYAQRKLVEKAAVAKPKKLVSKKYLPSTHCQSRLLLAEGESALGSLAAALGRKENGFFELRGVPISAEKASLVDFLQNEEVKLLQNVLELDFSKEPEFMPEGKHWYTITLNGKEVTFNENDMVLINGIWTLAENIAEKEETEEPRLPEYKAQKEVTRRHAGKEPTYKYVGFGADSDADGNHIRGLLLSLFRKYAPHLLEQGKILQFRTPLICLFDKNNNIVHHFFTFDEFEEFQKSHDLKKYRLKYFKGLGAWNAKQLSELIEKLGESEFFIPFVLDEHGNEMILNWFVNERIEFRKEALANCSFNLAKI